MRKYLTALVEKMIFHIEQCSNFLVEVEIRTADLLLIICNEQGLILSELCTHAWFCVEKKAQMSPRDSKKAVLQRASGVVMNNLITIK